MSKKSVCLVSVAFYLNLVPTGAARAELVGWWKLDEGSGITAYDSSGNGNDGTLMEGTAGFPEWKTAPGDFRVGTTALEFHGGAAAGEGDLVDCGNSALFDITDNITFALWVKIEAFTMTYQYVFSKGHQYMILRANDTRFLRVVFNGLDTGDGDDYYAGGTTIPIDDGQWHHVAASYDRSTGVVAFYTDGILEESKISSGGIPLNTDSVCIGRRNESNRKGTDAIIDDVRLYNHTLSEVEILSIMQDEPFVRASGPSPQDGTLHTENWVNLSWRRGDLAVSHDVYIGEDYNGVNNATHVSDFYRGNQTDDFYVVGFPGFAYPDGLVPGTTYYWRIDEINDANPDSPWKGNIWSFSIPPTTAYYPNPTDGAELTETTITLSWTPGYGAKMHTVYFGDDYDEVSNATGGVPIGAETYSPGTLQTEKVYYWRVDEFDSIETYKGNVWCFTTPGAVGNPQPTNGATDLSMAMTLSWTAADNTASHQVYLGLDKDTVRSADSGSPEYLGAIALGAESVDLGYLEANTKYYWRVDEVYNNNTVKGPIWSFTVGNYIVVDDFESYNDIDPPDAASNRIFDIWIDGFGTTTNGALVGNDLPPYAEQTIVHGGSQSMVYRYDNTNKTSEATLTLVYPRDWSEEGLTNLSLWFRGASANSVERMYVALNGNAVVYHDETAATQKGGWNQWVIDLTAFSGVNLASVNTITIGIGTKGSPAAGGTGTMYFDDIRLIR